MANPQVRRPLIYDEKDEEKRKDEAFLLNESQPLGMAKGGSVIKASYKGTGPVDIGSWTAPTKSRGAR